MAGGQDSADAGRQTPPDITVVNSVVPKRRESRKHGSQARLCQALRPTTASLCFRLVQAMYMHAHRVDGVACQAASSRSPSAGEERGIEESTTQKRGHR